MSEGDTKDSEVLQLKKSIARWVKIVIISLGIIGTSSFTVLGYYNSRFEKVDIINKLQDEKIAERKKETAVLHTQNQAIMTKQSEMHEDLRDVRNMLINKQ